MTNRFHDYKLSKRIVEIYDQLSKVFSKLNKTASYICFIQKAIYNQVRLNFVKVQGHFPREELRKETERQLLYEHLSKRYQDLKKLCNKYKLNKETLRTNTGPYLSRFLLMQMRYKKLNERLQFFKTKIKKLRNLLSKNLTNRITYSIPGVNLSNIYLTKKECVQLSFGL